MPTWIFTIHWGHFGRWTVNNEQHVFEWLWWSLHISKWLQLLFTQCKLNYMHINGRKNANQYSWRENRFSVLQQRYEDKLIKLNYFIFTSVIHICVFFSAARATATATLKTRTAADDFARAAPRTFATAGGNARYRLEFLDVVFPIFKSYLCGWLL